MLEVPAGRAALAKAYKSDNTFLMTVLLSAASQRLSFNYGILVLKFCDKLFQAGMCEARGSGLGLVVIAYFPVNHLIWLK